MSWLLLIVNIGVHVSFQIMVFSGCVSRSCIAGSYVNSVFSFLGTPILFSLVAVPIYILTTCVGGYAFLHTLSSNLLSVDFSVMAILTGVR